MKTRVLVFLAAGALLAPSRALRWEDAATVVDGCVWRRRDPPQPPPDSQVLAEFPSSGEEDFFSSLSRRSLSQADRPGDGDGGEKTPQSAPHPQPLPPWSAQLRRCQQKSESLQSGGALLLSRALLPQRVFATGSGGGESLLLKAFSWVRSPVHLRLLLERLQLVLGNEREEAARAADGDARREGAGFSPGLRGLSFGWANPPRFRGKAAEAAVAVLRYLLSFGVFLCLLLFALVAALRSSSLGWGASAESPLACAETLADKSLKGQGSLQLRGEGGGVCSRCGLSLMASRGGGSPFCVCPSDATYASLLLLLPSKCLLSATEGNAAARGEKGIWQKETFLNAAAGRRRSTAALLAAFLFALAASVFLQLGGEGTRLSVCEGIFFFDDIAGSEASSARPSKEGAKTALFGDGLSPPGLREIEQALLETLQAWRTEAPKAAPAASRVSPRPSPAARSNNSLLAPSTPSCSRPSLGALSAAASSPNAEQVLPRGLSEEDFVRVLEDAVAAASLLKQRWIGRRSISLLEQQPHPDLGSAGKRVGARAAAAFCIGRLCKAAKRFFAFLRKGARLKTGVVGGEGDSLKRSGGGVWQVWRGGMGQPSQTESLPRRSGPQSLLRCDGAEQKAEAAAALESRLRSLLKHKRELANFAANTFEARALEAQVEALEERRRLLLAMRSEELPSLWTFVEGFLKFGSDLLENALLRTPLVRALLFVALTAALWAVCLCLRRRVRQGRADAALSSAAKASAFFAATAASLLLFLTAAAGDLAVLLQALRSDASAAKLFPLGRGFELLATQSLEGRPMMDLPKTDALLAADGAFSAAQEAAQLTSAQIAAAVQSSRDKAEWIFSPVPALPAFTISLSPKKEAGKHRKHKGASRSPALSYEDVLSELSALTKTRWTFREAPSRRATQEERPRRPLKSRAAKATAAAARRAASKAKNFLKKATMASRRWVHRRRTATAWQKTRLLEEDAATAAGGSSAPCLAVEADLPDEALLERFGANLSPTQTSRLLALYALARRIAASFAVAAAEREADEALLTRLEETAVLLAKAPDDRLPQTVRLLGRLQRRVRELSATDWIIERLDAAAAAASAAFAFCCLGCLSIALLLVVCILLSRKHRKRFEHKLLLGALKACEKEQLQALQSQLEQCNIL